MSTRDARARASRGRPARRGARLLILAALAALALTALAALALDVPPLQSRVNDYAGMISPAARQELEARLADLERTDSTQMTVLTVPTLSGDSLEDFSIRVAEAWKVGQKGRDNGAILLAVRDDRKLRIEVGYGLEGKLTDLVSGQIIRNIITPEFKAGDFDAGFIRGVEAMAAAVRGEFKADPARKKKDRGLGWEGLVILLVVGVLLFEARSSARARGASRGGWFILPMGRGGGFGSFGGGGGGGGFSGGGGGFGGGGSSGSW